MPRKRKWTPDVAQRQSSVPSPRETSAWVETEFATADLGDQRLNRRLRTIVADFLGKPEASIPQASGSWARTKAVYRFLRNKKVTPEAIFAPQRRATLERIQKESVVLAVQDTTTLNFTQHPATQGLGTVNGNSKLRGMLVHTTLAFTPDRVPVGIIHQQTWVRPLGQLGKKATRRKRPIQKKESQKWRNSLAATAAIQRDAPDVHLINVGDREADIYDLFLDAQKRSCDLLVRASWDRRVEHPEEYLWATLQAADLAGEIEVVVPRRRTKKSGKQIPQRTARVEVRFKTVTLRGPRNREKLPPVTIQAIYIHEPHPPRRQEPLSWLLLTMLPVNTFEDAVRCIKYYTVRWWIEIFHKVLKSGCLVEERQLQTANGLRACLALDSIVALRVMTLTLLGRAMPDLPCTALFEDHEWKALYCYVHETARPPPTPPSLAEAVRLVARLGGFLGRKQDGHPGVIVLWRGMQTLIPVAHAWRVFGPERSSPSH